MPVEIREIIIKTEIASSPKPPADAPVAAELAKLKSTLVAECQAEIRRDTPPAEAR